MPPQVDKHSKHFTSWQHLVSMIFSQFSGCVSLREISNGLRSATGNLNHLGIHTAPSKSNLAYQNEHRKTHQQEKATQIVRHHRRTTYHLLPWAG